MAHVDKGIIEKNFWWYKFWQRIIAVLLFLAIPAVAVYLCWMFKLGKNVYIMSAIFIVIQLVMLYFSPKWMLNMIANYPDKYELVTAENHPEFHKILVGLAEKSKIDMPNVYIIDSETPNAFALKIFGGKYIACITRRLMEIINDQERDGVMAHEFGHIANDDVKLTMYIAAFNILLKTLSSKIMGAIIQRGLEQTEALGKKPKTQSVKEAGMWLFLGGINMAYRVLTYFPYIVALLFSRIMQQKEYRADAHAVYILDETEPLKNGLIKLQKYAEKIPMFPAALNALFATPVANHFFVWPLLMFDTFRDQKDALKEPTWGRRLRNLFESHPLTYDRIKRMESYEVKE